MTSSEYRPKKTKKQLKRSAMNSLWLSLLITALPLTYIIKYNKLGYIHIGKSPIIITGYDALFIMYCTLAVAIIAVSIAGYNITRCIIKIRRADYSEKDEDPTFVICKYCKTPQYSKDLIKGRCARCSGIVVNLEGYYKHRARSKKRANINKMESYRIVQHMKRILKTYIYERNLLTQISRIID